MPRHHRVVLWFGVLGLMAATTLSGAQQPPAQRVDGTLKVGVQAVLIDVVVRDKHGAPVRDLQQSDFEVLEDGVPQTIGSFTPIFEDVPAPTVAAPAAAPVAAAAPAIPKAEVPVPIT